MSLILFSNDRQAERAITVMTSLSNLSGLCHIIDRPPLLPSHSQQSDPSALSSDWRHLGLLKSHKRDRGVRNQKVCSVFYFCGVSLFFLSFPLQSRFTNMISDRTEVRQKWSQRLLEKGGETESLGLVSGRKQYPTVL